MSAASETASSQRTPAIRSLIPARIDRLPWSRFHTRLVMALGVAWIMAMASTPYLSGRLTG